MNSIYLPMKMSNRIINWHGLGILYFHYLRDHAKYTKPLKVYNRVILDYEAYKTNKG